MTPRLPRPGRERFQPLRSGLVNLYRYDDQEFWFEDGHLLLRGNNGTGKSRVLALQLPFLFDGEVAAHRMEPDGDPAKRVEWNLLMGGRHADRVGYTWIEFGRRTEPTGGDTNGHPAGEGEGDAAAAAEHDEFVTIGCGLSAVAGRPGVNRWFFVTKRRLGRDFFLIAPTGQPLSRERLCEALGAAGSVFTTAASYREAVDRELFHLGKARYEALVSLLIQLRQPQLSRQLDEQRLSDALSEALAPPAAQIVADVAEAMRGLAADREQLDGFRAASHAVQQFVDEYRRYAQIAARRRAAAVRLRHSAYEATMRRLREAQRELETAGAEETAAVAAVATARLEEETAIATAAALAASPAMQDAQALRRAREAAARAAEEVTRGEQEATRRAGLSLDREQDLLEAQDAAGDATLDLAARRERLREAAAAAGVESRHTELVAALTATSDVALTARGLEALLADRRRALAHLRKLGEEVRVAHEAWERAEALARALDADVGDAAELERVAAAAVAEQGARLLASYRAWAAGVRQLVPPAPEAIVDALAAWVDEPMGASPISTAAAASLASALERLAGARAANDELLAAARASLAELHDERERLAAGTHSPPPAPATRDADRRQTAAGAPFWRLVDFADDVAPDQRAGIEAALEGAGILDAWVTTDGRLLGPGEHDVVLVADGAPLPAAERTLGTVLRPEAHPDLEVAVGADTVTAILARIGFGGGSGAHAWVAADGTFRLGPLAGRFGKPVAEHIGESARAVARRRRLEVLAVEIERAEAEASTLAARHAELESEMAAARAEAAAAPDDREVRVASAELEAAGRTLHTLRGRLVEAAERALRARAERDDRHAARAAAAVDLGLAAFADDLVGLEHTLGRYAEELAAWKPAVEHERATARRSAQAAQRATEARGEAAEARERAVELRGHAARLAAECQVLESSVGAAAEEILARYAETQRLVRMLRAAREDLGNRERTAFERKVRAQERVEHAGGALAEDEAARDVAAASLVRFAATRLLAVAVASIDTGAAAGWSVTRTVEVARAVEASLEAVDAADAAWERSGKGLFAQIQALEQALLPHGHQATTTMEDELIVVEVPFQGQPHTMAEFGDILAAEVTSRQMLLSAREREILENHLVGEVSLHLHDRMHAAERLVREMNDELAARPMSTGMTLRFAWKALEDGPPGLAEARQRLMRAGGTWSPQERETLGSFLHKRIADVRAANLAGTWQDHLTEALDYRRWHHFGVERQQDGVWKPLTRRTHGTGSGGEKAVALTLPQFAAAAAHYRSADRKAPRLILLDEVFVGVDSDMRSKCMGLLATFDLDFVMTSEREWGCYPTLPSLAIYQLATRPGIDAVGLVRFVWNGRSRHQAEVPAPGVRGAAAEAAPSAETPAGGAAGDPPMDPPGVEGTPGAT